MFGWLTVGIAVDLADFGIGRTAAGDSPIVAAHRCACQNLRQLYNETDRSII